VETGRHAVGRAAANGDLELARQPRRQGRLEAGELGEGADRRPGLEQGCRIEPVDRAARDVAQRVPARLGGFEADRGVAAPDPGSASKRIQWSWDAHITQEDMIGEGDKVAKRWTFHATHKGSFLGIAPTDKRVEFTGTETYRIVNDRIVELWWNWDVLSLMRQLGAIPEMAMVGTR
jgi:hypothetical protein